MQRGASETPTAVLGLVTVGTVPCPVCHISTSFTFAADQYENWSNGLDAEDAFPGLTGTEALLLVSGIHPVCWEAFRLEDPRLKR